MFGRLRLREHQAVRERRPRALDPSNESNLVTLGRREHHVAEHRSKLLVQLRRIVALIARRLRPRRLEDDAQPVGDEGTTRQQASRCPCVEPRYRRRVGGGGSREQAGACAEELERAGPRRCRAPRDERDGKPRRIHAERHRAAEPKLDALRQETLARLAERSANGDLHGGLHRRVRQLAGLALAFDWPPRPIG